MTELRMTELILIRHGQTELNRGPFFQGQIDVPLNATGLAQAERLGERLAGEPIDAMACSDLLRTRQTAAPAASRLALAPLHESALREQRFGLFEGRSFDDVAERWPDAFTAWLQHDPEFALPGGGESVVRFHGRVLDALRAIAGRHPGRRIAVITHGGVLDMVWRTARGLPLSGPRTCPIPNAGLNRVAIDGDAVRIIDWADDAHVADLSPAATPAPSADAAQALQASVAPASPSAA
jgi:probable phosphoglycerate mutase